MALEVLHNFQRDLIKIKGDEAYGQYALFLIVQVKNDQINAQCASPFGFKDWEYSQ